MTRLNKLTVLAAAVALSVGLSACGGGGSSTKTATPEEMCTAAGGSYADGRCTSAEELAVMAEAKAIADALAEAEAAADALTAASSTGDVDAAKALARTARDAVTGAMHASASATAASLAALNAVDATITTADMAVMDRIAMETATANRAAMQSAAIRTAAAAVDTSDLSTPAAIAAASAAIAALQAAIDAAVDVDDTSMYESQVTAANTAVMTAQGALDHAGQTDRLSAAVAMLRAIDLSDLTDQAKIDAAAAVIAGLQSALDAATELSDAEKSSAMADLATANRTVMAAQVRVHTENQKMALSDAVDALAMIDTGALMTQDAIDAAERAIAALEVALAAASNLTDAEKLDATVDVTLAKRRVASAQEALDTNVEGQRMALMSAGTALGMIDLGDLDTQEKIDAADAAVMALKAALDMASHLSDSEKAMYRTQLDAATETVTTAQTGMDRDGRMMAQRTAITTAVTMARAAVGMVDDDATDAEVMAADDAIAALKAAIDGADDLPEGDTDVATAQGTLTTLVGLLDTAKTSRMAAMDEKQRMANEAMAVTAAKLFAGISEPKGDIRDGSAFTDSDRTAAYNIANATDDPVAGVPGQSLVDTLIMVSIGDGSGTPHTAVVPLTEDKKTMVAENHGWAGKRYMAEPDGDGMYEAVVYSNVGEPTPGKKFGSAESAEVGDDQEYRYLLTSSGDNLGEVALDQTAALHTTSKVTAIPSFDLTAGTKEYPLQTNRERVMIPGSYHGVPGTYYCVAGTGNTCAVRLAVDGFRLGQTDDSSNAFAQTESGTTGGTWTFKPTDRNARVMGTPDAIYASYGWWIHKSEDGNTFTASAFVDNKGAVPAAAALDDLQGTATYMGGAAGKYALSSSTGGANDAGHFTARATLEADFSDNKITGTIDMFKGADGMDRDWSVELKEADVGIVGVIARPAADDTVWTRNGTPAAASGWWAGTLYDTDVTETDTSGVPKVGTGTFYTMYGSSGKMVGAFGVNRQ